MMNWRRNAGRRKYYLQWRVGNKLNLCEKATYRMLFLKFPEATKQLPANKEQIRWDRVCLRMTLWLMVLNLAGSAAII